MNAYLHPKEPTVNMSSYPPEEMKIARNRKEDGIHVQIAAERQPRHRSARRCRQTHLTKTTRFSRQLALSIMAAFDSQTRPTLLPYDPTKQ